MSSENVFGIIEFDLVEGNSLPVLQIWLGHFYQVLCSYIVWQVLLFELCCRSQIILVWVAIHLEIVLFISLFLLSCFLAALVDGESRLEHLNKEPLVLHLDAHQRALSFHSLLWKVSLLYCVQGFVDFREVTAESPKRARIVIIDVGILTERFQDVDLLLFKLGH